MRQENEELIKTIEEYEKEGKFNEHTFPIDYSLSVPVTEDFPYIKKGLTRIKYALEEFFLVKPFTFYMNERVLHTKVFGKENIKGLKKGIITCNHTDKFEYSAVKRAFKGHKVSITAANFNNRSDFLGEMMRAAGLMPLSESAHVLRKFNEAIKYKLDHKEFVLFFPEQAMWLHYEKPRPLKNGAFHYAVKYNVPVIPTFITFTHTSKFDKNDWPIVHFNLHVLEPIYPKNDLNNRDNVAYMKEENERKWQEAYEKFYGKPLAYLKK